MPELLRAPSRLQAKHWPIIEIFGPTIQGEGPEAGMPCLFVRFGGCDFRFSWCDSLHAVEPAQVRARSIRLGPNEIISRLHDLSAGPQWVILSGGNPALHELGPLVEQLRRAGYKSAVETQGSRWRDWLAEVDRLVVSPKPPSSGMATSKHREQLDRFMQEALAATFPEKLAMKIVVFDEADLDWAIDRFCEWPRVEPYLSVGTDQQPPATPEQLGARYRWLCERVSGLPELADVRVLPQLHVIAWGHAQGV
jgi:7-carboxy-7-deazaguanine synthase